MARYKFYIVLFCITQLSEGFVRRNLTIDFASEPLYGHYLGIKYM